MRTAQTADLPARNTAKSVSDESDRAAWSDDAAAEVSKTINGIRFSTSVIAPRWTRCIAAGCADARARDEAAAAGAGATIDSIVRIEEGGHQSRHATMMRRQHGNRADVSRRSRRDAKSRGVT